MTLPAGSQSMAMGGMKMRAQGMDGRKKAAGVVIPRFSTSVTFVTGGNAEFTPTGIVTITPAGLLAGDKVIILVVGTPNPGISGGSNTISLADARTNAGGQPNRLYCIDAVAADAGATYTIDIASASCTGATVDYVVYRGAASFSILENVATTASVSSIAFSAPTLALSSSRVLAFLAAYGSGSPGNFNIAAGWTSRVRYTDRYGGSHMELDIASSALSGAPTFTAPANCPPGIVGFLIEFVGT
jgi:hypothetical protein